MRIERPLKAIQVDESCNICKEGFMRPTGSTLTNDPPLYEHKCTKCGWTTHHFTTYPKVEFIPDES